MTQLDRHALAEEREWRLRNYQDAVRTTIATLVDAIQKESRRALEREIDYDDDIRSAYTYADQAAEVQHCVIQALNNADFRSLTRSAAELHALEVAAHSLANLREELPVEVQAALAEREDDGLRGRIEEKENRRAELEARDAAACRAAVHQSGRGVGFHQCQKKGSNTVTADLSNRHVAQKPVDGKPISEVKLCAIHYREFESRGRVSIHVESDWSQRYNAAYRAKEAGEITRMKARLSGELAAADAPLEIEP